MIVSTVWSCLIPIIRREREFGPPAAKALSPRITSSDGCLFDVRSHMIGLLRFRPACPASSQIQRRPPHRRAAWGSLVYRVGRPLGEHRAVPGRIHPARDRPQATWRTLILTRAPIFSSRSRSSAAGGSGELRVRQADPAQRAHQHVGRATRTTVATHWPAWSPPRCGRTGQAGIP